jgi:hypothetical protein
VLDHAGSFLEAGDDGVGEALVVEGCGARLAQYKREGGLGEKKLDAGVLGADPQNLAYVAAKRTCRTVDELEHVAHIRIWDVRGGERTRQLVF